MNESSSIADLIDQSLVLERAGDVSAAFQQARRALDQARVLDQPTVIAAAQNCLATLHFRTGHHAEASVFASEVLGVAPPDSPACADALIILGNCAAETHSLIEAETFFHQAANLGRLIGHPLAQLRALHGLGQGVYLPRGQFDLALASGRLIVMELRPLPSVCAISEWRLPRSVSEESVRAVFPYFMGIILIDG